MTPEAVFAQLADKLELPHLIELGFMLCGTYAPENLSSLRRCYDLPPLATPESIAGYLNKLGGNRGLKKARQAVRYVKAGAGSVSESKLAVWFGLPGRLGGVNLLNFVLNPEIVLDKDVSALHSVRIRRPDFLWPDQRVAAEYDSKLYHDSSEKAELDRQRRNELEAIGLRNFIIRPTNTKTVLTLEQISEQIARAMGRTIQSSAANIAVKRHVLFEQLFGNEQWGLLKREDEWS